MKLDVVIKFQNGYEAITENDKKAKGEKNDCFVRAIMNACDVTYDEAHAWVEQRFNRKKGRGTRAAGVILRSIATGKETLFSKFQIGYLGKNPLLSTRKNDPEVLYNKLYPIKITDDNGNRTDSYAGYTVGKFIQQHQTGSYIILVAGHALAVKDGVMVDNGNYDDSLLRNQLRDQRRCEYIFRVKKSSKKVSQKVV